MDWDSSGSNDLIGRSISRWALIPLLSFDTLSKNLQRSDDDFSTDYGYAFFVSLNELKIMREAILLDPKKKGKFSYKNSGRLQV
tara:strand:- start:249 stop:500 length:252 start_codon:yes stop_codon:yes gene_type:complete